MINLTAKVIDISSHQGEVDFGRVKSAGYTAVIIKAGQGLRQMSTFRDKYLPAALDAGMEWGAYWWSDAVTVDEAKQEAQCFLKALEGLKPTYPVYMDQEYGAPCGTAWGVGYGKQLRTDMAKAFLETLQNAGYYAGLYASKDWLENWVDGAQLTAYDKWVAQYASKCTYAGTYGMWQHHGNVPGFIGYVDGISVPVDLNDCYKDYPAIIKNAALNGWGISQGVDASEPDYKALYEQTAAELKEAQGRLEAIKKAGGWG